MVPIQITALLLAAAGTGETVLYDFQATWCGPCKMMAPVVDQLSAEGYPVRKIDVDQNSALARQYGVTNIPCFVLVVDGKERGRIIGATSYQRLSGLLSAAGVLPNSGATLGVRGQSPDRPRKLLPLGGSLFSKQSRQEEPAQDVRAPQVALGQPADEFARNLTQSAPPQADTPRPLAASSVQADRLLQASVRLKVFDPQGHSLGSGTIIDSQASNSGVTEALILTCGHIFRDSAGKGRIEVDLFDQASGTTVLGRLVHYDLQNDLGFVSVSSQRPLPAIPLAPETNHPAVGDWVLSIGCDHGNDPTVQQSTIKAINSFVGPPNLQVGGQPAVGRSGGGLFNDRGELIGVCNFADPTDRAGLYGAAQLAHATLRELSLQQHVPTSPPAPANTAMAEAATTAPATQELICIVRTGSGSDSSHQVLVIDNASRSLLEQINAEHLQKGRPFPTSMSVDAEHPPQRPSQPRRP